MNSYDFDLQYNNPDDLMDDNTVLALAFRKRRYSTAEKLVNIQVS